MLKRGLQVGLLGGDLMSKLKTFEGCDDPECVFCGDDDGEAAFWDEFMALEGEAMEKESVGGVSLRVVDGSTGRRRVIRGEIVEKVKRVD